LEPLYISSVDLGDLTKADTLFALLKNRSIAAGEFQPVAVLEFLEASFSQILGESECHWLVAHAAKRSGTLPPQCSVIHRAEAEKLAFSEIKVRFASAEQGAAHDEIIKLTQSFLDQLSLLIGATLTASTLRCALRQLESDREAPSC
jgi:hypothetical protein